MKIFISLIISIFYFQNKLEGQGINYQEIDQIFANYSPRQLLKFIENKKKYSNITLNKINDLIFCLPTLNPITQNRITSRFGYRIHPINGKKNLHTAIDIAGSKTDSIYASADGIIHEVGYNSSLGNFVKIKHCLGFITIYGHLKAYYVKENEIVFQGQKIGLCGSTGSSTGTHLHFGIIHNGNYINPQPFIFLNNENFLMNDK